MTVPGPPRRTLELGAFVVGLAYDAAGTTLALSTGAGQVLFVSPDPDETQPPREIGVHGGASLCFGRGAGTPSFLSGGDDGRL